MASDMESSSEASPRRAEQVNVERLEEERLQQVVHEFQAYKSEVMAMYGVDDETTHESMKRDFLRLRDNIQSWIDACEKHERRGHYMKRFEEAIGGEMDGRQDPCFSLLDLFQAHGGNPGQLSLLRRLPDTCNCIILTLLIWDTLERWVFLERDPLGMDYEVMRVIMDISEEMCRQNTTEVCRKRADQWRAVAIRTCIASDAFQSACQQEAKQLQDSLTRKLEPWISKEVLQRHEDQLNSQVLQLAIKLAQDMCCSQTKVYFEVPRLAGLPGRQADLPGEARDWELKNIRTWTLLSTGDAEGYFCYLFPALHVERVDQPLVKSLLVAYKKDLTTKASENPPKFLREYSELQKRRPNPEVRKKSEPGDPHHPRTLFQAWNFQAWKTSSSRWGWRFRPKRLQRHSPSATRSNTDGPRSAPPYRSSQSENGIFEEPSPYGTQSSRAGPQGSFSTVGTSSPRAEAAPSADLSTRSTFPKMKEPGKSSKHSSSAQRAAPGISAEDRNLPQGRHSDRPQSTYGERAYQSGTPYPEGTSVNRYEETKFSPV